MGRIELIWFGLDCERLELDWIGFSDITLD